MSSVVNTESLLRLPTSIRRRLGLPIRNLPVTIRNGPIRGARWSLPVSGRGIAAGTFEQEKFAALAALLEPGDVFWDVGAHYGYATLVGRRAVGPGGHVLALEPSAHNRWFLERHLRWNAGAPVRVLPFALAEKDGVESFGGSASSVAQKLGGGEESVEVRTVTTLIRDGSPVPDVIKIDIEGAESRALAGAQEAISSMSFEDRPSILCAVHDPLQFDACVTALNSLGYLVIGAAWFSKYLSGGEEWREDPDVLAITPARSDTLTRMRATAYFGDGPEL